MNKTYKSVWNESLGRLGGSFGIEPRTWEEKRQYC